MAKEDEKFELASEVSEMLGFDSEFESKEDFKTKFEEKYIVKKNIADDKELTDSLFGKVLGSAQTKLKSSYKDLGVEFEDGELKDKKFEEIIAIGSKKLGDLHTSKFDEFKTNYEGDGKEEIEKLQNENAEKEKLWSKKYEDEKGLNTDLRKELESQGTKHITDLKDRDLSLLRKKAFDSVKWATESESFDLKLKGFKADFNEKYDLDLDENQKLFVTNKDGEKIKSSSKVGEFESVEDILEKEAKTANLLKINGKGGKPVNTGINGKVEDGDNVRQITTYNR